MSVGSPVSGLLAASWLPALSKASLTSPTVSDRRRTEPSPRRVCQSRISLFVEIERFHGRRSGGCGRGGASGAEAAAADETHGRAHDAVAHDEHRHGGAADDVDLGRTLGPGRDRPHVLADERVHRIDDAALGNADEDDGFLVVDELDRR